jgi:hypothetical protein
MGRKLPFALGLIFLMSLAARAQDKIELFGGYSFERFDASRSVNLNGWEVSGQYKFVNFLGIVGDLDAHYGSLFKVDFRTASFMAGPQVSFPARISPFAHILVGVGHVRVVGITDNALSTALGGGIDMQIAPRFSWRIFQADDAITRFFGGTQHNARVSTGIVFRF